MWTRNIAKQTYTCKTNLFFKIKNNITPDYLRRLLPEDAGKNINYNWKYSQDIQLPKPSKNYFLKSYIPSSIKLWNEVTENIRSIAEADTFKTNLKQYLVKWSYKPYLVGNTEGHIHLARIRMKLSGLNSQWKKTPLH